MNTHIQGVGLSRGVICLCNGVYQHPWLRNLTLLTEHTRERSHVELQFTCGDKAAVNPFGYQVFLYSPKRPTSPSPRS